MIELLRRVAAEDPTRLAILTHDRSVTYADLVEDAESVADALVAQGIDRFATVDHEADVIVPLLAGASAAGTEMCQYPPAAASEVAELVQRFGHDLVVSARDDLDGVAGSRRRSLRDLLDRQMARPQTDPQPDRWSSRPSASEGDVETEVTPRPQTDPQPDRWSSRPSASEGDVETEVTPRPEPGRWSSRPSASEGDVETEVTPRPHLVLTTGTTGAPRGVRHDWSRLLRGTTRVAPAPDQRWLLAYGLHQFAGLQVLLHVFAAGATLVAPAPRRPVEGLAAMRELGVTHASATPTYWRFLLAELGADGGPTPPLRQVTLGGEAVPGPLLAKLEQAFPDAAVSQVYAASEFGATSSMRDRRAGLSTDVLERGEDADVAMKVVDGELWVRSRTGMLGYHGEEPVDADGWRPTGDMVEVVGDRILFRGRSSEIINVGGVKVHPLPIEERVGAVPGVAVVRVFGRPNPMTGAIVAVEVVAEPGADTSEITTAVRAACEDLDAAARPRSVRVVDELTTAGDKIIRRAE